jgi:flavorubredoxin
LTKVITKQLSSNLYLLRVDDDKTRYFEALWEIPEGITYNAYLLKTSEGDILFDGWKSTFTNEFIETLSKLTSPSELKYIVVHHMEPDHTGSIKMVSQSYEGSRILVHPLGKKMLNKFYDIPSDRIDIVKNNQVVEVGGKHLRFIYAPWIHWPETMFTLIEEDGLLLTCDAFGGYGLPDCITDLECVPDNYMYLAEKYMVTVVGHYRKNLLTGISKVKEFENLLNGILPGHGLLWVKDPSTIINAYEIWAKSEPIPKTATVIQVTMYGQTDPMVSKVELELWSKGYRTKRFVLNDEKRPNISDILATVNRSGLLVLAAGTYEANVQPLMRFILEEIKEKISPEDKKVIVISSYGWGSVASKEIKSILEPAGWNIIEVIEPK